MDSNERYVSDRYEGMQDTYNSIAFRLDPAPVLAEIRSILLNEYAFDEQKQVRYRPKGVQPKFDVHGIEEFMLMLKGRMSVDKVLSKLEKNEINMVVRQVVDVVYEFIMMKGDQYGVKESDYSDIAYLVWHNVKIFLNRALGGTENELVSKGFLHREVVTKSGSTYDQQPPPQQGKGPAFLRGFR